jgi:hypothetical protein
VTQIAVPWETALRFVRLTSNSHIYAEPATLATAWSRIESLLDEPNVWVPTPTPQHRRVIAELVAASAFTSNDVPDIHLAALAISHGLRLASHDRGFARFEGLRWFDPLAA